MFHLCTFKSVNGCIGATIHLFSDSGKSFSYSFIYPSIFDPTTSPVIQGFCILKLLLLCSGMGLRGFGWPVFAHALVRGMLRVWCLRKRLHI